MGIFDSIKSRLGGGEQDEYSEDDQYYDGHEDYESEYEQIREDDRYYDDAVDDSPTSSRRRSSVFNDYTPLVSMSDVRSQELPRYTPSSTSSRAGGQDPSSIRTSLPYVGTPTDNLSSGRAEPANYDTGRLGRLRSDTAPPHHVEDSADPLFQRHSLAQTGDFAATSPAYYASRSGVGHVRPSGQARRTHKFREAVVISPEVYADAEQVATNLRRGNAVVLVLTQTRPELAKRILDFCFGAAALAEGQVVSIGERIYAITRDHALTDTEKDLLQARGII